MCHQSVGLIGRQLEAAGITTVSLTSARSITESVGLPRAAFVDFPLGHTAGKPFDPAGQREIVLAALRMAETATVPGTIVDLGVDWGDQAWRADPLRGASATASERSSSETSSTSAGGDSRTERHPTPQYQTDADRDAAVTRLGEDVACRACVGFDG